MEDTFSTAFLLLFVGMFTVVVILSLVVLSGKLLIAIINRFFPMAPEPVRKQRSNNAISTITQNIPSKKLAAIVAAVEIATGGRGTISSIEKVK